jgi:hypothetical protein
VTVLVVGKVTTSVLVAAGSGERVVVYMGRIIVEVRVAVTTTVEVDGAKVVINGAGIGTPAETPL